MAYAYMLSFNLDKISDYLASAYLSMTMARCCTCFSGPLPSIWVYRVGDASYYLFGILEGGDSSSHGRAGGGQL